MWLCRCPQSWFLRSDPVRAMVRWYAALGLMLITGIPACAPVPTLAPERPTNNSTPTSRPAGSHRFSTLLTFESPVDLVFVKSATATPELDPAVAQTGAASLKLPAGRHQFDINFRSLMTGRPFPADWTLLLFFARAETDARVTLDYGERSRTVDLTPGQWVPVTQQIVSWTQDNSVMMEAKAEEGSAGPVTLHVESAGAVWIDDLTLVDNKDLVAGAGDDSDERDGAFVFERRGFELIGGTRGAFQVRLATPEASPNGWTVADADLWRVRLASQGARKTMTIWRDGRVYTDGKYSTYVRHGEMDEVYAAQHVSPAQMQIPEAQGRVNYNAAGDGNNDGYVERDGTYQAVSFGPRLEIQMTPRSEAVARPIIEVSGLPPGKIIGTVEGRLIQETLRLKNGNVLIDLPVRIERAVTLKLRVE